MREGVNVVQNFDTSTSLVVMNSSSAGFPSCVALMPRLIEEQTQSCEQKKRPDELREEDGVRHCPVPSPA